ncbi:unnamed protein product [Amoebophrya sp. A25]|nr:unnamed protein product [Amoebophrya sp. A25]|eukprot:GSA25T00000344001.1
MSHAVAGDTDTTKGSEMTAGVKLNQLGLKMQTTPEINEERKQSRKKYAAELDEQVSKRNTPRTDPSNRKRVGTTPPSAGSKIGVAPTSADSGSKPRREESDLATASNRATTPPKIEPTGISSSSSATSFLKIPGCRLPTPSTIVRPTPRSGSTNRARSVVLGPLAQVPQLRQPSARLARSPATTGKIANKFSLIFRNEERNDQGEDHLFAMDGPQAHESGVEQEGQDAETNSSCTTASPSLLFTLQSGARRPLVEQQKRNELSSIIAPRRLDLATPFSPLSPSRKAGRSILDNTGKEDRSATTFQRPGLSPGGSKRMLDLHAQTKNLSGGASLLLPVARTISLLSLGTPRIESGAHSLETPRLTAHKSPVFSSGMKSASAARTANVERKSGEPEQLKINKIQRIPSAVCSLAPRLSKRVRPERGKVRSPVKKALQNKAQINQEHQKSVKRSAAEVHVPSRYLNHFARSSATSVTPDANPFSGSYQQKQDTKTKVSSTRRRRLALASNRKHPLKKNASSRDAGATRNHAFDEKKLKCTEVGDGVNIDTNDHGVSHSTATCLLWSDTTATTRSPGSGITDETLSDPPQNVSPAPSLTFAPVNSLMSTPRVGQTPSIFEHSARKMYFNARNAAAIGGAADCTTTPGLSATLLDEDGNPMPTMTPRTEVTQSTDVLLRNANGTPTLSVGRVLQPAESLLADAVPEDEAVLAGADGKSVGNDAMAPSMSILYSPCSAAFPMLMPRGIKGSSPSRIGLRTDTAATNYKGDGILVEEEVMDDYGANDPAPCTPRAGSATVEVGKKKSTSYSCGTHKNPEASLEFLVVRASPPRPHLAPDEIYTNHRGEQWHSDPKWRSKDADAPSPAKAQRHLVNAFDLKLHADNTSVSTSVPSKTAKQRVPVEYAPPMMVREVLLSEDSSPTRHQLSMSETGRDQSHNTTTPLFDLYGDLEGQLAGSIGELRHQISRLRGELVVLQEQQQQSTARTAQLESRELRLMAEIEALQQAEKSVGLAGGVSYSQAQQPSKVEDEHDKTLTLVVDGNRVVGLESIGNTPSLKISVPFVKPVDEDEDPCSDEAAFEDLSPSQSILRYAAFPRDAVERAEENAQVSSLEKNSRKPIFFLFRNRGRVACGVAVLSSAFFAAVLIVNIHLAAEAFLAGDIFIL